MTSLPAGIGVKIQPGRVNSLAQAAEITVFVASPLKSLQDAFGMIAEFVAQRAKGNRFFILKMEGDGKEDGMRAYLGGLLHDRLAGNSNRTTLHVAMAIGNIVTASSIDTVPKGSRCGTFTPEGEAIVHGDVPQMAGVG